MTDVVVQDLTTEQKVRIPCNDYVKKLAVYRDCLAVQLPHSITIYQLNSTTLGTERMQYTPIAVVEQQLECNLLVITAEHLTLCQVQLVLSLIALCLKHSSCCADHSQC